MSNARKSARAAGLCGFLLALAVPRTGHAADVDAKRIFGQRCSSCHTFGRGVKVGPDLKGVTSRRERPWLLRFIRSSQTVIQSRDPLATALFDQFRGQRMPDWTDLSEGQIGGVLDWLAANGPDQKDADERDAASASAADIERARGLFDGSLPLSNGGAPCATCHAIRDEGRRIGGNLGPDLSFAYLKYRDRGLTLFLRQPCFRREPESSSVRYLVPDEIFALKAYLRYVALPRAVDKAPPASPEQGLPSRGRR
jgi:mono/diheme cytochrome c family protein